MKIKKYTWYKVYHTFKSDYNGKEYTTFEYAMNDQVEELENKYKSEKTYVKTEEWKIWKQIKPGNKSHILKESR